jgi:hypothetical protein
MLYLSVPPELENRLPYPDDLLDIGGEVIVVDATDLSTLDYEPILAQIKAMISEEEK